MSVELAITYTAKSVCNPNRAQLLLSRVQLVLATLGVDRCGGWGLAVVANITDSGELMG